MLNDFITSSSTYVFNLLIRLVYIPSHPPTIPLFSLRVTANLSPKIRPFFARRNQPTTYLQLRRETQKPIDLSYVHSSNTMTTAPLRAVTLTLVRYRKGDQLGHFLAWVSLIPVFVSLSGFICHFIFRREIQGMFFALGLLISQFLNELVKDSVQQARPETCALLETCDSLGWPSSHSQYMFFFAVYFTFLTYRGIGLSSERQKLIVASITWVMAFLTMYSRVYLGYHTVSQVFAGATFGFVLGVLWYWVVNSLLICYFPVIEESSFGRKFYVKDTSHIPNVLKFEYENARAARKNLAQKLK